MFIYLQFITYYNTRETDHSWLHPLRISIGLIKLSGQSDKVLILDTADLSNYCVVFFEGFGFKLWPESMCCIFLVRHTKSHRSTVNMYMYMYVHPDLPLINKWYRCKLLTQSNKMLRGNLQLQWAKLVIQEKQQDSH